MIQKLLAEVDQRLRCGKGSGRSPPCVTRWSGGAVSHHRRIAAAAGAAKQLIMLLNLEVNITAGSLTSCPGRGVDAGCHLLVRPEHGGRRRAVDALDWHFRGGGDGAALLRGDGSVMVLMLRAARWFY